MSDPTRSAVLLPLGPALAAVALALAVGACGGGGSSSPSAPSATPPPSGGGLTVTISADGVKPRSLQVPMGGVVTFVNSDSRTHQMMSDPNPQHNNCPAINDVGTLTPGQNRSTGKLDVARTCGFHDHTDESNTAFKGSIVIQ